MLYSGSIYHQILAWRYYPTTKVTVELLTGTAFTDALRQQLRPLFGKDLPVGVRCQAMLDGKAIGRVVVDDPDHPSTALLQEEADRATFFGGRLTADFLAPALEMLRQEQYLVLGFWPDDPVLAEVRLWETQGRLPKLEREATAVDFTKRDPAFSLEAWAQPPPGCCLQRIDLELARRLKDEWLLAMFGSFEVALQQGLGFCLMRDEQVLCQAFAGPAAQGIIEIGVGTSEGQRGKGYATITCARLIDECERGGYQTFWNTSANNLASLTLARKLGYRQERPWAALIWEKSDP